MANLTLASLNVRLLGSEEKRNSLFKWFLKIKCNVIFLQETHTTVESESVWNRSWKGPVFFSHGSSNSRGCSILISDNVDFKILSVRADSNGRFIILQGFVNERLLTFVNVYSPNIESEQILFLNSLDEAIGSLSHSALDALIVGGDWNVVRDMHIDKYGGTCVDKPRTLKRLNEIMFSYNICDVWR